MEKIMNIDKKILHQYVDGGLSLKEEKIVEDYLKEHQEDKIYIEDYKKLNKSIRDNYLIDKEDLIPQRTIDLINNHNISIFKRINNLKVKLVPTLLSFILISFGTLFSFNTIQLSLNKSSDQNFYALKEINKSLILTELEKISGTENYEHFSSYNQEKINYKIVNEFNNNSGHSCQQIQFIDFKYKDLNIEEAVFCKDGLNDQKLIKLNFFKGSFSNT